MPHKQHKYNHDMLPTNTYFKNTPLFAVIYQLFLLNFTATNLILLSVKPLINDTGHYSNRRNPIHPSEVIHHRLKIKKISLTRRKDTAKSLSWEYRTSHKQYRIYTTAHENCKGMHQLHNHIRITQHIPVIFAY